MVKYVSLVHVYIENDEKAMQCNAKMQDAGQCNEEKNAEEWKKCKV